MAISTNGLCPTRRAMTPPWRFIIWTPARRSIQACSKSTSRDIRPRQVKNHSCFTAEDVCHRTQLFLACKGPMRLSLTTWNINSVRLRIDLVARFIKAVRPDVLCLQETKCIDDAFPLKRFRRLGYEHVALNGQKGYH